MRTAYPPLPTEPRTPLARVNESGWAGSWEGARKRESSLIRLGETKIPAHGLAVSVESRSAVGNDRVSHAETPYTPQRHVVRIRESSHRKFSIRSQSPYKQQDTYRMALGRTYRTANAVLPCHKEMCTALLIAYLGSIALAALGGETWKRSKVERCNSL